MGKNWLRNRIMAKSIGAVIALSRLAATSTFDIRGLLRMVGFLIRSVPSIPCALLAGEGFLVDASCHHSHSLTHSYST